MSAAAADGGLPFEGFTLRLHDPATQSWRIWWSSTRAPGVLDTPVEGRFAQRRGESTAVDTIGGRAVEVRFVWLADEPAGPRWEQSFSYDAGRSWTRNWTMQLTRR